MNFEGNFRRLPDFDISQIKDLAAQLTQEHWGENQARQQRYKAHKDTQAIPLFSDDGNESSLPEKQQPAYDVFVPILTSLFRMVANYYKNSSDIQAKFDQTIQGYFIRINLVNLRAGGMIPRHRDKGYWLTHSHRVHVPIITNDQVHFAVGNDTINMKEGEVFEVNNRRVHSVVNEGAEDRVHLILDWVFPQEPCCCSQHRHPGAPCGHETCFETDNAGSPCNCYPEQG